MSAAKNATGKAKELSPAELMGSHLDMVFTSWCLSNVKVVKEHRVVKEGESAGSKRTPKKKRPEGAPDWWNDLQRSAEYKEANEARRKELKEAAKATFDLEWPEETPLVGIELVPWHGLVKEDGTGLLWSLVLPQQAGTTTTSEAQFTDDVE